MAALRDSWQLPQLRAGGGLHALPGYSLTKEGWIIYDIGENNSTKMDEELAKEVFTFSDAELKESARKAKLNFLAKKEEKLRKRQ